MMTKLTKLSKWIPSARRSGARSAAFPSGNRGIALLFALLLLAIMSALGVLMVLTVNPDMMINGYYGNYRGSFYAADSGMNIARQQLLNLATTQVNMTPCIDWEDQPAPCNNAPLSGTTGATVLSNLKATYSSFTPLQGGQAANSWPENFEIADTATCTNSFAIAPGYPIITHGNSANYKYGFLYNLCITGRAQGGQHVTNTENGMLYLNIAAQSTNSQQTNTSFASFGTFVQNFPPCFDWLWGGIYSGPTFTNGAWNFGPTSYIFTDPVGQANPNVSYWGNWGCAQSPTSTYTNGGQTIAPTFQQGLNLNQPSAPVPPNSFSQEWAVLDSLGCGEGSNQCGNLSSPAPPAVTHSNLNAVLKNISGTPYPSGGAASGVYLPYSCSGGPCVLNGGGFYVEGNTAMLLTVGNDGSGNPTQIYTFTQGATVTSITTNVVANTTTVISGGNTLNLTGVPESLLGSSPSPSSMVFVDGTITSMRSTGQGVPAIQDNVAMTITATGDINITGDVIYKTEPVTMDTNDTLVPGALTMTQDLGMFTATGSIIYSSPYSNGNIQSDGSAMALGQGCSSSACGFKVNGCVNDINQVGGAIQANEFPACGNANNIYFDRRYTAIPGFGPPWFPTTSVPGNDITTVQAPLVTTPSPQRLSWITTPQ